MTDTAAGPSAEPAELEPLARPEARTEEREAARRGELAEAAPVICEGGSLPLAGSLVILPALVATGLVEVAEATYGRARAAFYGLRSLVLTMVFTALLGEPRAEGLTRLDPIDVGRLLGRSLLREIFASPADLQIVGDKLHVTINPLSAPRRTRALTGLCADLTATHTTYPGTNLTLVYAVKDR